ncbi:DNRLRE domain-containing protein [Streptomyces phaeochromogenes]
MACLVISAVVSTGLPNLAYAAPVSGEDGDGGAGIVDAVKGWFSDDEDADDGPEEPQTGGTPTLPSREKLPKGEAVTPAKRVAELTGKRTANERFWTLSDGRVQAEVSSVPTAYRAGKFWKDIDTTVRATDARGFDLANTTNVTRSWFGSHASRLLRFESGSGHTLTLGLDDADKLTPTAKADTVTYKDATSGADLSYEVGPGQVKENIVLGERPAGQVSFTFTLDTGGLRPKAGKDGSIALYGEAGDPALVIPAAFMTDAMKDAESPYGTGSSTAVDQKLTKAGDEWKLTVTPDATWLAAKKRQYPVTIAPATIIDAGSQGGTSAQGVTIASDGATTNYSGSDRLSVGNTGTGALRALLQFPLSGVPAGTRLDSADLRLFYDRTYTTDDTEVRLEAHRATEAWSEPTATWKNARGITGELSGTSVLVDDGDAATTAARGAWPAADDDTNPRYAARQDYLANKDSVSGDTYTWRPSLPQNGDYRVETHYVPASDRATDAPYTVTYAGGSKTYEVDQRSGSGGVWKALGTHPFKAGTLGKVVLGDGPGSTKTAVLADAVRFTKDAVATQRPGTRSGWHSFAVTSTVQSWMNGTNANHGFVVKAGDEGADAPEGGPRYTSAAGGTDQHPRLVLTFGRPGVELAAPTTVHDTGAVLNWSGYTDPSALTTRDDLVEYQVHRSTRQDFTPSASTLLAPVAPGTTAFTDTTAEPTKAHHPNPLGRTYYYTVAVKTKDGQLTAASAQQVRLPKAGRTTKVIPVSEDTTLSSARSTKPHDTIDDGGTRHWVTAGSDSPTYGTTRTLLKFPALGIPDTARVLDATVRMWGTRVGQDTSDSAAPVYELRPLTRDFDEKDATWTKAAAGTGWRSQGGDFGAVVSDTASPAPTADGRDPARSEWNITPLAQSWVSDPSAKKGVVVKAADEKAVPERTLFLSSETAEQPLRPSIAVTYVDATTDSTYYAPQTPARMTTKATYTVDFTLTNTTAALWKASDRVLTYRWALPDGTDVGHETSGLRTELPADLAPGESVALQAKVDAPHDLDWGNKRTEYALTWDLYDKKARTWLSESDGIAGLKLDVTVEDPTSDQLGLEKFYSYSGRSTGAGSTAMVNTAAGNSVWSYNAFSNPGRGLTTFARFSYNSQDTSDTNAGPGWSFQLSGPIRLGAPLDFHPALHPKEISLPDGDGTSHVFRKQDDGSWKAPAGVHYLLAPKPKTHCLLGKDEVPDAWTMTRPDGTRFLFDCDGYLTSVVDKNGNTQTFTYEERKHLLKPVKYLSYITDPAGRRSLSLDYYDKHDADSPLIVDHVKSMTDISGRKVTFEYSKHAQLTRITDGAGSAQPKVFRFEYDDEHLFGIHGVKLVKVTDPRGHHTRLAYYHPKKDGDEEYDGKYDLKYHGWTRAVTDRLRNTTTFAYKPYKPEKSDAAGTKSDTGFTETRVTDAEKHPTDYVTDDFGRPVRTTNAKAQTSELAWDADNNVTYLEEANGAATAYCYDQKTGYPLWKRDAEENKDGVPPQSDCAPGKYPEHARKYEYQTWLDGFSSDLFRKSSPEGRTWQFGYDSFGNLKTVTDPKGVATPTADDYTTAYEYDTHGQLTTVTDANGNATVNSGFGPTGYPTRTSDALNNTMSYVYDERGHVTSVKDPLGKETTQTYDTYGRPLVKVIPKDQAEGQVITTPAPVYDPNDNVTKATAPNGAVSLAKYDAIDLITEATEPRDSETAPERTTTYTYDKTGHARTTTEPQGNATTDDPGDYTTTNHYDEIYQLTSVVNALGDRISFEYNDVGDKIKVVDPKKNATPDPDDYSARNTYDLNHRIIEATDALGKSTSSTYDRDSLNLATRDPEGNKTLFTYDERGKQTESKVPHSGTGDDITYRITRNEYDEVGNSTKVVTPRGVETDNADDFASRTEYDSLNRPVKQFQPYDPADPRYNSPNVYTQTFYDEVGRVTKTSLPQSEGQSARNETSYTHFDNGWLKSSTDPLDIVTAYDYNDLGQQTSRTLTSAGGSSSRTMGWDYYPNGKLKEKTDDGVPVGSAVPFVDNSDIQNVTSTGTWTKGDAAGQQGLDHQVHAAGAGTDSFTWTLNIPQDGTYTAYVKFPQVTGAATAAKYTVGHKGGTTDKTADQTSGAGTWVSLGSYEFTQGNDARLQLSENADGAVVADGVKLVRDISGDPDAEKHDFRYGYDRNGNLSSIDDRSSGAKVDAYTLTYTELNQVAKVTEALAGEEKKTTGYTYDANSQAETVTHPDQYSKYTYDLRDLASTVSVGKSATDPSPKVTSYTYTDRGQVERETKDNGNTVDSTYNLDRSVKATTEKKDDGALVASHTYAYEANGNKARDVAKKMNADDNSEYLESTTEFTYDPVDRLARSVKSGNGAATETYIHDDNANVVSQTVDDTTTTFTYDRNRLQLSTTDGAATSFNYDPFGRQESVSKDGQIVSRSVYDGFDHVVESQQRGPDNEMKSTTYTFDPLDRTASKTAEGKTTDYTYLGLSQEVLNEEIAGKLTKSYQYSPWGQRLSQIKQNDDGTAEDAYYGYNSHTDVETLTDDTGDTKATYGYTAYGNDDRSEFTGIDKPDATEPTKEAYNSYRYNAKRWDEGSGTYDMGFRDYDPGLNRFTTRDMYNGALADMGLGSDPFTGSRYAFTGGNPISNVEIDGHFAFLAALAAPLAAATAAVAIVAAVLVVAVIVLAVAVVIEKAVEEIQEATEDEEETAPEPKPTPRPPGPGTDTDQKENNSCRKGGQGWVEHKEVDAANGNRATGVQACLTPDNIGGGTPTAGIYPPGYQWAKKTAGFLGASPRVNINACHLLGKQLGGSGTDLKNLATCSKQANDTGISMRTYEDQVRAAVEAGQDVLYTVTPMYGGNRTVPVGFQMSAYGTNPDGTPGIQIDDFIPNTLRGRNLGLFDDPNTGAPVPTGGTP